jgi:hypothetical protein
LLKEFPYSESAAKAKDLWTKGAESATSGKAGGLE